MKIYQNMDSYSIEDIELYVWIILDYMEHPQFVYLHGCRGLRFLRGSEGSEDHAVVTPIVTDCFSCEFNCGLNQRNPRSERDET